jgi:hypothetical protein
MQMHQFQKAERLSQTSMSKANGVERNIYGERTSTEDGMQMGLSPEHVENAHSSMLVSLQTDSMVNIEGE